MGMFANADADAGAAMGTPCAVSLAANGTVDG